MPLPNLPYQLGKTYTVGNKQVHTRTVFSQRMGPQAQGVLVQALARADAALTYCIGRAAARAPAIRNGTYALGPFDFMGNPTVSNFSNDFLDYFRTDAAHLDLVASKMDTFRNLCVSIQRGLLAPQDIVDLPIMTQGGNTCGYVTRYQVGGRVEHRGAIHIDFGRLTAANVDDVANTLIHEAAHKFTAAKDHAYRHEVAKWGNLSQAAAIENADSISRFAMAAFTGNLQ